MTSRRTATGGARARVFAITSGKGGVGKTSIALNLSIILSRAGGRVLLVDADMGLANVDILTGITASYTIEEVINGEASIFDALAEGPEGLTILPALSGLGEMMEPPEEGSVFHREMLRLESAFDFMFIDTGAGISANVVRFVFMADEVIVVMTPEPTAFADAYAMVKLVTRKRPDIAIGVIANMVKDADDGDRIARKFTEIVDRFLGRKVRYRGGIVHDTAVGRAVMRQVPLALDAPKSPAMTGIKTVARNILERKTTSRTTIFSR